VLCAGHSIGLEQLASVHARAVFALVLVDSDVALVVMGLAEHPTEDVGWDVGVEDPARRRAAEPGGDVVAADGAPEDVCGFACLPPALDSRKEPFDPGPVATDLIVLAVGRYLPRCGLSAGGFEFRHQVFRAGQQECVAVNVVQVAGQAPVCLAGDGRQRKRPSHAERPISSAGVIAQ